MRKNLLLTSLVTATLLFTACGGGGGSGDGGSSSSSSSVSGDAPTFTSVNNYTVVKGQRKSITLTTGEFIPLDGSILEFAITEKSQVPSAGIDDKTGVIKFTAPDSDDAFSLTVTATRVSNGAVSDPMTITFTPTDPGSVETLKPVKTGAGADAASSGRERTFTKNDTTEYNVVGPTGLIWVDHNEDSAYTEETKESYLDAKDHCEGRGYRLPNKDEFLNIIDYSMPPYKYDGENQVEINPPMLPQNTNLNGFVNYFNNIWVQEERGEYIYASENGGAYYTTDATFENAGWRVRCVKGDEENRYHLIHSDILGYTYDEKTKLEWSPASDTAMSTADAITYCENHESTHTIGGQPAYHTGFRLPSINELRSIIEGGTISDYITKGYREFSSSTPYVDENGSTQSGQYWKLTLREDGKTAMGAPTPANYRVICVRDMD